SGSHSVGSVVSVHLAVADHGLASVGDSARGDGRAFSARAGGGCVSVDLAVAHVQFGRPCLAALVSARGAAAVEWCVPVHLTVAGAGGAEEVLDASPPGVRSMVAVDLAVADGQHGLAARAYVVAAGDSAAYAALGGVAVHRGVVEGRGAIEVQDPS